jgi:hypothetical protein
MASGLQVEVVLQDMRVLVDMVVEVDEPQELLQRLLVLAEMLPQLMVVVAVAVVPDMQILLPE